MAKEKINIILGLLVMWIYVCFATNAVAERTYVVGESAPKIITPDYFSSLPQAGDTIFILSDRTKGIKFKYFSGSNSNPIVFINAGGQVTINDQEFWGALNFENCKYIKVSGTGCDDVNYGFKLSAQTCGLAFTEYSSECEAEFIEINHTGFFGVYAKKDFGGTPPTPLPVFKNLVIHDTYVTNVAVGMYLGETKSPGMEFRHVRVFNNVVKHTKREGIQVANMVEDIEVYNNVLLDNGLDGEAGQGNNLQIGDNSVGKYYNNILKGAPGCGVIVFGAGDIEIFNNFLEDNTGIFIDNRLFTRLYAPISIENNYFVSTKNNKVVLNYNEINPIVVKSNFYDGSCPFMLSTSSAQKNLESENNQLITTTGISFSDTIKYIPAAGSLPATSLGMVNGFTSFNSWPVLSSVEEQYIKTGDTLKISLQASTLDGDKIEFQLDSLPNFALAKDSINGIKNISFYPKNADAGKYEILITALEASGRAKDRIVLNLSVAPGENHLPVMKFKPIEIYSLKYNVIPVHVSDLDHDKISLSLSGNPDFIHIKCENDSIYHLVIEPGYTETGTYSFNFHLTDSYSEPIISAYSINILPTKLIPDMPVYRLDCGGGIDIDIPGNELNWKHVRQSSGKEFVATSTWETGSGSYKGLNETSAPNNIFGSYSFDYSGGSEMQWKFPVLNGKYRVNLFFRERQADIDFDGTKAVFDVNIENTKVLSSFCIFDESGESPLQKGFESVVRDQQLNINFKQIAGKPKICGIEIIFLEAGNNPPVITKISNIQLNEGDTLKLPILVTDDSDFRFSTTTVSLLNSPKFAHIQFDNGKNSSEFVVDPDYFSAGNYSNIKLKVNDGEFADSTVFSIFVNDKVRPNYPNFVLPDTLLIGEGETKTLSKVAFDPENDSFLVNFSGPKFVSLKNESGWNLEVKPGYYDSGNYKVYLSAKDQNNYTTKDSVLVVVENVNAQIVLQASMVKDEVTGGSSDSPNYLVDEQTLTPHNYGVPISKSWKPATNSTNAPFNCTIDLGSVYEISRISIHDMYNVGPLVVSTGKPLEWKELFTIQTDYYNAWKSNNVEVKSRYIRLTMNAGSAAFINEIVVYGTKSLEQPVESTPVTDTTTTNPPIVEQTVKQIVLNSQMIIDEVSGGSSDSPKYLVDEQGLNIDIKQHAVSKSWKPFYNSTKAPYNTTIDLGSEYVLKKICFHDMNNTGPMIISYGEPGKWQTLYIENFNTYNNWLSHAVDVTTRYLRLTIEAGSGAYTNEVMVFGYQTPQIGLKKVTIIPTTNVEKPVEEEIKVYPTRFSESLNVSIGNDMTCAYRISLYNSNGQRLFDEKVSHIDYTNQTYSTDSWNLTPGLYILSVRNENTNQIKTFKLVKQ